MIGGSYGGAIQLATAAVDHRVDALVPLITWNDLSYSLDPNNAGRTAGRHRAAARCVQVAVDERLLPDRRGAGAAASEPRPVPDRRRRLSALRRAGLRHQAAAGLRHATRPTGPTRYSRYARSVSPVSYLTSVKAPTLLVQGQADSLFNLNEATATYRTLKAAQGTPAKMIWQSWGHSGGMKNPAKGELDLAQGNLDTSYVGQRILAWFDRYLHHQTATDTGPAFAYYRDWVTDGPRLRHLAAPSPRPAACSLYLSGDGTLVDNRGKVARGSRAVPQLR